MKSTDDEGVILVLLERFKKQRLPKALRLKERVDAGERLSDADIAFLEEVFSDAQQVMPILDRNPELEGLASQAMQLYREITEQALKNEQA